MSTDSLLLRHVIVGAGHAGRRAAEALRAADAQAQIIMIGAERHAPYDRPVLSKDALLSDGDARKAFVRNRLWYDAHRIELRLATTAEAIDRERNAVRLADGETLAYDRLLIATGSRVRSFGGSVDERVTLHYVRTLDDSLALRAALAPGKTVAILGGGFIGLEVAAAVTQAGCTATVIEPSPVLLQRSLPVLAARFVESLHKQRGVAMMLGTVPSRIGYDGGRAVVETDHGPVAADIIVAGIGVVPNLELARAAGLEVDRGIVVDAQCRTIDPQIFAAGEVTQHFNPLLARHVRVESWQVAENQPAVAAANMLGGCEEYAELPWLWSDQFDCNIQTLGLVEPHHQVVVRGSANEGAFCILALDEQSRLAAAVSVNAGREISVCRRLIASGKQLDPGRLADSFVQLRTLL